MTGDWELGLIGDWIPSLFYCFLSYTTSLTLDKIHQSKNPLPLEGERT